MASTRQTVGAAIQSVLPDGSAHLINELSSIRHEISNWEICPMFPTDVFAVSAYLLKIGGVVAFYEPSPYADEVSLQPCQFTMNVAERLEADEAGEKWRDPKRAMLGEPPESVQKLWDELIESENAPVTPGPYLKNGGTAPTWWKTALKLAMISDMACNRLLRDPLRSYEPSPFESWLASRYQKDEDGEQEKPPASLCIMADPAVVCVMPKVRVAPVGATLRNISRNLALLPGGGEVRCSWHMPHASPKTEDIDTLDILLIPEPIELAAANFQAQVEQEVPLKELHYYKRNWENFGIVQSWLNGFSGSDDDAEIDFIDRCVNLVKNCKAQSRSLNGVIFPEYALNYSIFSKICDEIKMHAPSVEFVISGSSDNCLADNDCEPEPGNHVLTRVWHGDHSEHETTSRRKHHRWRMDRRQVETYALSSALNPKVRHWWEDSPIGRRELHFHRFRQRSVFSVLICEELARSDPCHEILRAVAPNLIFALLLDGPQIKQRWPAQYASNLADDPGSSVLTFTSFGLIDRSNKQGKHSESRSIAMWKDDTGNVVEIDMPKSPKGSGILLSLWSEHVTDRTLTGKNSEVRSWRYSSHFPIDARG